MIASITPENSLEHIKNKLLQAITADKNILPYHKELIASLINSAPDFITLLDDSIRGQDLGTSLAFINLLKEKTRDNKSRKYYSSIDEETLIMALEKILQHRLLQMGYHAVTLPKKWPEPSREEEKFAQASPRLQARIKAAQKVYGGKKTESAFVAEIIPRDVQIALLGSTLQMPVKRIKNQLTLLPDSLDQFFRQSSETRPAGGLPHPVIKKIQEFQEKSSKPHGKNFKKHVKETKALLRTAVENYLNIYHPTNYDGDSPNRVTAESHDRLTEKAHILEGSVFSIVDYFYRNIGLASSHPASEENLDTLSLQINLSIFSEYTEGEAWHPEWARRHPTLFLTSEAEALSQIKQSIRETLQKSTTVDNTPKPESELQSNVSAESASAEAGIKTIRSGLQKVDKKIKGTRPTKFPQ